MQQGPLNKTMLLSMDMWKREDVAELFRKRGMQRSNFFLELFTLNMGSGAQPLAQNQDKFYHHEDDFWKKPVSVLANVVAGAAGAEVTFKLGLDSIVDSTKYYVRVNDILAFDDFVTAQVKTITVNGANDISVVVRPNVATQNIPALTAGMKIGIRGNAKSRGSGQPPPLVPSTSIYSHVFQIIADAASVEGSILAEADWINSDQFGMNMPDGVWTEALMEAEYRQTCAISDVLLNQQLTTNSNVDPTNSNAAIQTTEGYFPWVLASGLPLPVAVGSFAMDDFDDIILYMKTQYSGGYLLSKLHITRYLEIQDLITAQVANSNLPQVVEEASKSFPGYRELSYTNNFQNFLRAGCLFNFVQFDELNDNQVYPQAGDIQGVGAIMPLGRKKFSGQEKAPMPYIGFRYKEHNNYSRMMEMWKLGGAGGQQRLTYTSDVDQMTVNLRSEIASDYRCGNLNVIITT